MRSEPLKLLIARHRQLFWDVREDAKENLSIEAVVQTILKFGDLSEIRDLFNVIGIKTVSDIFFKQISQKRNNYPPRTIHFFKEYFKRYA